MQGKAFFGNKVPDKRKYVFGHRDRVDEARDFARSVRNENIYTLETTCHIWATTNQPLGLISEQLGMNFTN